MIIKSVELENIKSHKFTKVDFDLGVNAIIGDQGSGKTTIVEAIGFVLFDSLPYTQKDFIRKGHTSGSIKVTVEIDGHIFIFVRTIGNNASYYVEEENGNIVQLKSEILPFLKSVIDLNDKDLDILFSRLIGPPQGTHTSPFLLPHSSRKALFDPILGIDEFEEAWKRLRHVKSISENKIASLNENIERLKGIIEGLDGVDVSLLTCEGVINDSKHFREEFKNLLKDYKAESDEILKKKDKSDLAKKIEEEIEALKEAERVLKKYVEEGTKAYKSSKDLKPEYDLHIQSKEKLNELKITKVELNHELSVIESGSTLSQLIEARESLEERLSQMKKDAERLSGYENAKSEYESLGQRVHELEGIISHLKSYEDYITQKLCPISKEPCPVSIDERFQELLNSYDKEYNLSSEKLYSVESEYKILRRIFDNSSYMKSLEAQMEIQEEKIEERKDKDKKSSVVKKKIKKTEEEITRLKQMIEDNGDIELQYTKLLSKIALLPAHSEDLKRVEIKISNKENTVKELKSQIVGIEKEFERFLYLEKECDRIRDEISRHKQIIKENEERIEELKPKVESLKSSRKSLEDKVTQLSSQKDISENIDLVREFIREVPPILVERFVEQINSEANMILHDMTELYDEIEWKKDYELTMDGKLFRQLSGGEEMTAAICIRLALLKSVSKIDFALFDEPTDGLDTLHRERLAEMISRVSGLKQLIVISHDSAFDYVIENTIHVEKKNDISTIK